MTASARPFAQSAALVVAGWVLVACGASEQESPSRSGGSGNAAGGAGGSAPAGASGALAGARAAGGASGKSGHAGQGGSGAGQGGRGGSGGEGSGAAGTSGAVSEGESGGSSAGAPSEAGAGGDGTNGDERWVLGYWAVWQNAQYPLEHVNWSAMTHAALSFVLPRAPATPTASSPYATLDTSNVIANLGASGLQDFAKAAHAGGAKALISLGGGGAGEGFKAAAAGANRAELVGDVLAACAEWHFDGVDLDWEDSIDFPSFKAFVAELRAGAPPAFIITVPVGAVNDNLGIDADTQELWSSSYSLVDQINVMTYTGTGNYPGWVVWYFSPLAGAGPDHPFDVTSTMRAWSELGIPKSKLGLGVGFYGQGVGPPVTAALEEYGAAELFGNDTTFSHGSILQHFYGKGGAEYHFDDEAMAPYLSWPAPFTPDWSDEFPSDTPPTVQFLTYEDEAGIAAKGAFAKQNGYGGAIIWTINEGVRYPYASTGYGNPLLDAVRDAFR